MIAASSWLWCGTLARQSKARHIASKIHDNQYSFPLRGGLGSHTVEWALEGAFSHLAVDPRRPLFAVATPVLEPAPLHGGPHTPVDAPPPGALPTRARPSDALRAAVDRQRAARRRLAAAAASERRRVKVQAGRAARDAAKASGASDEAAEAAEAAARDRAREAGLAEVWQRCFVVASFKKQRSP